MATLVTMPKLSDTMEEGAIASWFKKEGDSVEEGESLAEIETDKATMEWESPEEGVILKLVVQGGGKAKVGAPIAVVGQSGESFDLDELLGGNGADESKKPDAASSPPQTKESRSAATTAPSPTPSNSSSERLRSSPLARKVAEERGIALEDIKGSGPNGRIVLRDLEQIKAPSEARQPSVARHEPARYQGEDELISTSMMRKTIAKRLLQGKNEAPHFYLTRSINMTRIIEWRARINADSKPEAGVPKVSVNDMIILACAKALRKHRGVNASWEGDHIRQFGAVNIAMAVALPTGLVTPVIRHCDQLGVRDIARTTKELAQLARDGKLGNDDFTGGTFTISNLGMMGIEEFTAIINPPQSAILAVGSTIKSPVVTDDDQIVIEPRMKVTLSCDHRVIDGMLGAQFLQDVVAYLEDPLMMLT